MMQRSTDGQVVLNLKQAAVVVALAAALWPAAGWLVGVDTTVFEKFPEHLVAEDANAKTIEAVAATQQQISSILSAEKDAKLREQIEFEIKCENPRTDLPRDFCQDVLRGKRMREANLR